VPAGALLFAFAWISRRRLPSARHWLNATPLGFLMLGLGNGLVCMAERSVPSGVVAVVIAITPSFVVGIPWLFGGPRPRTGALVGIALGLLGVAVLSWKSGSAHSIDGVGLALVVSACLSWAIALLLAPRLSLPSDPLYASALPMLTGGGALALASVFGGDLQRVHTGPELWPAALAIAYLAVFGSITAYTAYIWLQRNAPPALATSNVYVNPVIALALGWALNGEALGARALVGSALVLVAVALIGRTDTARSREDSLPAFSPAAVPDNGE
jgi:drug/metabolite transporter (DMT)-like permease